MKPVIWVVAALLSLSGGAGSACGTRTEPAIQPTSPAPAKSVAPDVPPTSTAAASVQRYGEPLQPSASVELTQLLSGPKSYADQRITVEGVVRQVCQARGCWLELATSSGEQAEGCRVVMKDHAFFVPTDSVGRHVRVQGQADVKTIPVAQVTHMEQEGGRFSHKQPDGSAHELRILATGVELLPSSGHRP